MNAKFLRTKTSLLHNQLQNLLLRNLCKTPFAILALIYPNSSLSRKKAYIHIVKYYAAVQKMQDVQNIFVKWEKQVIKEMLYLFSKYLECYTISSKLTHIHMKTIILAIETSSLHRQWDEETSCVFIFLSLRVAQNSISVIFTVFLLLPKFTKRVLRALKIIKVWE